MNVSKKSKHPSHDDPTAFGMRWPKIVPTEQFNSAAARLATMRYYKMGKLKIMLHEADDQMGYFMSIQGSNRYPTWDEIVWIRYTLIPDSAIMSLILPNLNSYINNDANDFKFTFTMEQKGWAIDPAPKCTCGKDMRLKKQMDVTLVFECVQCRRQEDIDPRTWNEQHGNGLKGQDAK